MSQKKLILIIDDYAINITGLIDILEKKGFETLTADYGTKGIKQAQCYQPDLILLNIKMPEMDGYEVCKRLKANERTENIPIIFLSVIPC